MADVHLLRLRSHIKDKSKRKNKFTMLDKSNPNNDLQNGLTSSEMVFGLRRMLLLEFFNLKRIFYLFFFFY